MRLSIEEQDDYDDAKLRLTRTAVIYLDDKVVERCITADEEQGLVVVYKDIRSINFLEESYRHGGDWPRETLYGKVRIVDSQPQKD